MPSDKIIHLVSIKPEDPQDWSHLDTDRHRQKVLWHDLRILEQGGWSHLRARNSATVAALRREIFTLDLEIFTFDLGSFFFQVFSERDNWLFEPQEISKTKGRKVFEL